MQAIKNYIQQLKITFGGYFFNYILPYRKKVIQQNVDRVFKNTLTQAEKKKLILAFYSHLARSLAENIKMRFLSLEKIKQKAIVVGHEKVLAAAEAHKGVLILTGHFGNWELAPIAGILNFQEYQHRIHFIRRTLGNKKIEKFLFRRYYQAGLDVIPKKNALFNAMDALDQNNAVVFILDQHAATHNKDGVAVEFFGEKAGTYQSLAKIARNTGCAVIPACSYRRDDGKHVLEFFDPIAWQDNANDKQAILENTRRYNQALEKLILARPEQWLWLHRRWKL